MTSNPVHKITSSSLLRKAAMTMAVFVCIAVLVVGVRRLIGSGGGQQPFVFYTVNRADLPIVVTERGNLESQVETTITCKVENVSGDRSGSAGTQIIFIVPNGSAVKEGDLLVEFDSATIRDRLDTQTLAHQKAISAKTQADAKYDNQVIQNETTLAEAELAIELTVIEEEMYIDPTDGTFRLAVEEIARQVDDAKNSTLEAQAALQLAIVERDGMKELFKLGYRGKSELDQSHLKYLQMEDRLASSVNKMQTLQGNSRKLTRFERKMEEKRLKGAVETAERNLKQVINDNASLEKQALAAQQEAENSAKKEQERLVRMENQLVNCKILAPHDGMVVYVRDRRSSTEIGEGAIVRERQRILTLPDLSRMKVKTQVHEAVLDQVRVGLPATVRVDAFPDRVYRAVVEKVAVVPSSGQGFFGAGGVKTYETIVRLVDEVESLKPGMTAVVNMHVDKVENVLSVPVQAVVQVDRETWCYVKSGRGVERRDLKIGRSNDKFVHVQQGLYEGDRVVLNSMDVFDKQERETNEISPESGVPELPESMAGVGFEAPPAQSPRGRGPAQARGPGTRQAGFAAMQAGRDPAAGGGRRQFQRGDGAGRFSGMQGGERPRRQASGGGTRPGRGQRRNAE